MTHERASLAAIIAVAFVAGSLAVEWMAHDAGLGLDAWVDLAAGWILAGSGLAAWLLAPRSRIGPLLVAAAGAWFLGTLVGASTPFGRTDLGRTAGFLVQSHAGFLVQAIVTWPFGRITRPTQLVVVAGGWIAAMFPELWYQSPGYIVLGALLAGGLLLDQRSLSPGRRTALRPALDAGLLLAAGLALIPGLAQALAELDLAVVASGARLWAGTVAAVGLMLAGSVIDRERRGAVEDLAVRLRESEGGAFGSDIEWLLGDGMAAESPDDLALKNALARASALTERNRALGLELAGSVQELEASRRRLVEVGDEERLALVERLQSGAGDRLATLEAGIRVMADDGRGPVERPAPATVVGRLARALDQLTQARADLDALALGLDPGRVGERGLDAALRDLASTSPVPVDLSLAGPAPSGRSVVAALYFVASEALANVARHARAGAVWLRVQADGSGWRLVVEDDGIGGADLALGTGLRGLQERLEALGGELRVGARPGGGTRLEATVPSPEERMVAAGSGQQP